MLGSGQGRTRIRLQSERAVQRRVCPSEVRKEEERGFPCLLCMAGSPTWDPNYHPYPFTLPAIDSPSTSDSLSGGRWMDRASAIKPKNDCFRAVFTEMKKMEWL
ncbi:hypothetical protein VNO80_33833 [Phaseolus coccineus]|uniref:Uncharacterized protein n=1 Tax=Phaseolus coccineus TaxID=3886 RepID=A0AAN9KYI4_PHACN